MSKFDDMIFRAQQIFPSLKIKFKNESTFMKIIGAILFFNPGFMTSYLTTIGNTIYFQNKDFILKNQFASEEALLHELVHIYDNKIKGSLFQLSYIFPQLLSILSIPLLFIFGWKIALIPLLFLAPIPSYFRMIAERRAYTISMYAMYKLNKDNKYNVDLNVQATNCASQFKSAGYYFMWPFSSIKSYFSNVAVEILKGNKPILEAEIYNIIDKIIDD